MSTENEESNNVRRKAKGTDYEDKLRVEDFRRVEESGDSLEDNRETQCNQEDGVEEGTEDLCSQPLRIVSEDQLRKEPVYNLRQRNIYRC